MRLRTVSLCIASMVALSFFAPEARADLFWNTDGAIAAITSANWGMSSAGPFTNAFVAGSGIQFTANSTVTGASITVGNVTVSGGATVTVSNLGSWSTGAAIRTLDIGPGSSFTLAEAIAATAGTGFIKNGDGVFGTGAGGTYPGGFTLNAGTVLIGGVNGMGASTTTGAPLTLNGGILLSNGANTRNLSGKYPAGITIGGTVQFGDSTNYSTNSGGIVFSNRLSLGGTTRTLVMGYYGTITISSTITNSGTGGITFAATSDGSGHFDITNAANTFTGPITIKGGEVRFFSNESLGNSANPVIIDGGQLATGTDAGFALGAGRGIQVGAGDNTAISTTGSVVLSYNGAIADLTGTSGGFTKKGNGTLVLGGVSTFSGYTVVASGSLKVNGNISSSALVTVNAEAVLSGTGLVSSIDTSGVVAPGEVTGTLTATGSLAMTGGTLALTLNSGTAYSALSVAGGVKLTAPELQLTLGYSPAASDAFTILRNLANTPVAGRFTFGGVVLNNGDSFTTGEATFTIDYFGGAGNDILLTVPEPATVSLLIFASGIAMNRRGRTVMARPLHGHAALLF